MGIGEQKGIPAGQILLALSDEIMAAKQVLRQQAVPERFGLLVSGGLRQLLGQLRRPPGCGRSG